MRTPSRSSSASSSHFSSATRCFASISRTGPRRSGPIPRARAARQAATPSSRFFRSHRRACSRAAGVSPRAGGVPRSAPVAPRTANAVTRTKTSDLTPPLPACAGAPAGARGPWPGGRAAPRRHARVGLAPGPSDGPHPIGAPGPPPRAPQEKSTAFCTTARRSRSQSIAPGRGGGVSRRGTRSMGWPGWKLSALRRPAWRTMRLPLAASIWRASCHAASASCQPWMPRSASPITKRRVAGREPSRTARRKARSASALLPQRRRTAPRSTCTSPSSGRSSAKRRSAVTSSGSRPARSRAITSAP